MAELKIHLWRGVHLDDFPDGPVVNEHAVPGVLYPVFTQKVTGVDNKGFPKFKRAEVVIKHGMVQKGGGTSLFNIPNFFKGSKWRYMRLPAGTDIDPNLVITGPDPRPTVAEGADHYMIEVAKPMYVEQFKGALDNFARAAVARDYELSRTGK